MDRTTGTETRMTAETKAVWEAPVLEEISLSDTRGGGSSPGEDNAPGFPLS